MDILQTWKKNKGRCTFKLPFKDALIVCQRLVNVLEGKKVSIFALGYQYEGLKAVLPNNTYKTSEFNPMQDDSFTCVFFDVHFIHAFYLKSINQCKAKYVLCFTKDDVPVALKANYPLVDLSFDNVYNEINYLVDFEQEDEDRLSNIEAAMKDIMAIFGNEYDNLLGCLSGNDTLTPYDFRLNFAQSRGWSDDIDTDIPMFADIDKCYNPNNLVESATRYQSLISDRDRLIAFNDSKVNAIAGMIDYLKGKRIVIVGKNGTFAEKLATAVYGKVENRPMVTPIIYSGMPTQQLIDRSTGEPICNKSGASKGKPKMFGETSLTSYLKDEFNSGGINWLCITGSIDKRIELLNVDILVVSGEKSLNYYGLKNRIAKLQFTKYPTIVNVLMRNTKEQEKVEELQKKYRVVATTVNTLPMLNI